MSTAVRPLTYLTRTTVILLVGLCLVAAWRAWADWFVVGAAENYYGIDPLTRAMSLRNTAGWAYTATLAVFFCWIWRARANAEHLSRAEHRLHRGWVIGGWLAPMLPPFGLPTKIKSALPVVTPPPIPGAALFQSIGGGRQVWGVKIHNWPVVHSETGHPQPARMSDLDDEHVICAAPCW